MIIPAHNEEAVIGRCLRTLLDSAAPGEVQVVVSCNGCHDRTADVARAAAPEAVVLETSLASKVAALNAGDRAATRFPRVYLDADVELPVQALRRLAAALSEPGVMCVAPKAVFDLEGRPWAVKAFFAVWLQTPYLNHDMVGTGVYALSEAGRRRFDQFPALTADDQFVHQQFARGERKALADVKFTVHPARTLKGLVAMRTRAYRGNRELASSGLAAEEAPQSGLKTALRLAVRPANVPSVAVYVAVNLWSKAKARRAGPRWERDDSSRRPLGPLASAGEGAPPRVCYVTSHYPALSHTFVMREVQAVRAAGVRVETASVHRADPAHLLAQADKEEAARTWSLFPLRKTDLVKAHVTAFTRSPGSYIGTLASALRAAPPGPKALLWQGFYFAEAMVLWYHCDELGVRHLHAHLANVAADISWLASSYGRQAAPADGWRWSFTMHGPTELYSVEKFNLERKVRAADAVICISEFTKSQLMYLTRPSSWGKLHVVHCGAELARYPFVAKASTVGEDRPMSVLTVARLAPQKGLPLLLEALALLAGQGAQVKLVLVGAGPLGDDLKRQAVALGIQDLIEFIGPVGQDDMAGYYAEADVFCLPSFSEGVPVALMEAMATGRPVVATGVAGIPELVEDGIAGLLAVPGSKESLAQALGWMEAHPLERAEMGKRGRRVVEESFDAARCGAQVADVFREFLGTSS